MQRRAGNWPGWVETFAEAHLNAKVNEKVKQVLTSIPDNTATIFESVHDTDVFQTMHKDFVPWT